MAAAWWAVVLCLSACGGATPTQEQDFGGVFVDATRELGLPTPPEVWPDGRYHMPEIMQGGPGLFDADGDGDLDLFQVRIPPPDADEDSITNRFFRRGADGRYSDDSVAAGIVEAGYGQGMAIGDADNDGDLELYVTNYGPDVYYENDGSGHFTNKTERAGMRGGAWSTAAAFCDYDADGLQDLYVVHYVRYDPGKRCTDPSERREYCGPRSFNGAPDKLYRNLGQGRFADVTEAAGIVLPQQGARAHGLGIAFVDLTRDGRPDVFVANDGQANQLWVNQGDGTFAEEGLLRGVALNRNGRTEASMGVTVTDLDENGAADLFMTHMWEENNRLYQGTLGPLFRDASSETGLARHDLERTGFGCGFFDFDLDGDQDLAVANGAVRKRPFPVDGAPSGMWADYAEPNQLFSNDGSGHFELAQEAAGAFGGHVEVSRGLALGDLDDDGDLDLVVSSIDNGLRVYRNETPRAGRHWLRVRLLERGRDALGARVEVRRGEQHWSRLVLAAASYGSSNDPRAHFGLGSNDAVDELVVTWTDGSVERFPGGAVDRDLVLRAGEGEAP